MMKKEKAIWNVKQKNQCFASCLYIHTHKVDRTGRWVHIRTSRTKKSVVGQGGNTEWIMGEQAKKEHTHCGKEIVGEREHNLGRCICSHSSLSLCCRYNAHFTPSCCCFPPIFESRLYVYVYYVCFTAPLSCRHVCYVCCCGCVCVRIFATCVRVCVFSSLPPIF